MRILIFAMSMLGILAGADAAMAGPSTASRDLVASAEPAAFADDASAAIRQNDAIDAIQESESQIGLDRIKRHDVARWLTRLGFSTGINGKFDDETRAVITRWQGARGYPRTGFLDTPQHQALLTEDISAAHADAIRQRQFQ